MSDITKNDAGSGTHELWGTELPAENREKQSIALREPGEAVYVPPPITGYRSLSQSEVDLVNKVKAHAEATKLLIDAVTVSIEGSSFDVHLRPERWIAEARTDLQKGYMCLIRAITRPETF